MDNGRQRYSIVPGTLMRGLRPKARDRQKIPDKVRAYSGWLPLRDAHEDVAIHGLTVIEDAKAPQAGDLDSGSEYREAFRNGATLYPRMLIS